MNGWVTVGLWGVMCSVLTLLWGQLWFLPPLATALLALYVADIVLKCRQEFWTTRHQIRDVAKKAVLITGCDTGFGHQLASRLSRKGLMVYAGCLSTSCPGAQKLAQSGRIIVQQLDVTRHEDVQRVLKTVTEDLRNKGLTLWSVVNNAGVSKMAELEFMTMADCRRVMEVNTFGPVVVTKAFLPLLRAGREGRVVNVVSQAGRFTAYGYIPYSMSKHALVSFSDGLRLEMKKWNITVHTVEPSLYRTEIVNMETIRVQMLSDWNTAPEEVRTSYGRSYFEASVEAVCSGLLRAREQVHEVVDDMEGAVIGQFPQVRYTPGTVTKALVRVLRELPIAGRDAFMGRATPKVIPRAQQDGNRGE